ncbi:MAG TPA: hypothetical protein VEF55_13805, partial [Candidatus Binatia bacterium]|nr:hypothetical protein [Candidatus Binatia bacterium]
MDVQVLRFWGMVVGSALIAIALWIAALGPEAAPARAIISEPVQLAQTQTIAPSSFLVRFRGSGPIARAQADAARGRMTHAQHRIEAQLRRQTAFGGLCFDRFTAGAAEVVLRTCAPVAARDRATIEAQWLSRLRGMRA